MGSISDCKVKFFIADLHGPKKSMCTVNGHLNGYISDFYSVEDSIKLLSQINSVLNGQIPECVGASQGMAYAIHDTSQTKIYSNAMDYLEDNSILRDYVLPTADFKQILKKWIEFLEKE